MFVHRLVYLWIYKHWTQAVMKRATTPKRIASEPHWNFITHIIISTNTNSEGVSSWSLIPRRNPFTKNTVTSISRPYNRQQSWEMVQTKAYNTVKNETVVFVKERIWEKGHLSHFCVFAFFTLFESSISAQYDAVFGIAIAPFIHEIYWVLLLCVEVLVCANTIPPAAYYGLCKLWMNDVM